MLTLRVTDEQRDYLLQIVSASLAAAIAVDLGGEDTDILLDLQDKLSGDGE